MKFTILLIGLTLTFCGLASAQEFAAVNMNPFGLMQADIENSALHVRYVDMDDDNDLDAVHFGLAEDTFYLSVQINIGNASNPNFGAHERTDLLNTDDVVVLFPDIADLNQDGLLDILAFGAIDSFEGYHCVLFENNTVTNGDLSFEIKEADQIGLSAVGDGLFIPELVDLNLDGDLDILMSGMLSEINGEDTDGALYYGQNISEGNNIAFSGWYENAYGMAIPDSFQFAISTAGDLDADLDVDILTLVAETDEQYTYYYFENEAPPGQRPAYSPPIVSPFNLVDSFGLPDLVDIDADGDLDLFLYMGETGVAFFENITCVSNNSQLNETICEGESIQVGDTTFNHPGNYQIVVNNQAGCDSTINLSLAVTSINSVITLEDMVLTAENTSADAYQWIDCTDNSPITGATASSYTPQTTGNYAVQISEANCIKKSYCIMVTISGIHDISTLGIVAFPNPADDEIVLQGIQEYDINQVKLLNATGQSFQITLQQKQLDVSNLSAGMYIIQLNIDGQLYISRVRIN